MLYINIVVDGGERFLGVPLHPLHQLPHHGLPVQLRELLHQLHVVEVVLQQVAGHVGQRLGDVGQDLLLGGLHLLGDLTLPSLGLQAFDERLDGLLVPAVQRLIPSLLVVVGHLQAQVTAAGVDDQVALTVLVHVQLDEVVAAAQGADALAGAIQVHGVGAAELGQVNLVVVGVISVPDGQAGRYLAVDELIQPLQLHPLAGHRHRLHAAADVHPHQVGHHLVPNGQGGADGAAHPGVDVGHDAYLAARCEGLVAEGLNLAAGARFQLIAEDQGGVVGSFDLDHIRSFL